MASGNPRSQRLPVKLLRADPLRQGAGHVHTELTHTMGQLGVHASGPSYRKEPECQVLALGWMTSVSASSSGHREATVRKTPSSLQALSGQALRLGGQVGGLSHSGLSLTWPHTGFHLTMCRGAVLIIEGPAGGVFP